MCVGVYIYVSIHTRTHVWVLTHTCVYIYVHISNSVSHEGVKAFLSPRVFFSIIFGLSLLFSWLSILVPHFSASSSTASCIGVFIIEKIVAGSKSFILSRRIYVDCALRFFYSKSCHVAEAIKHFFSITFVVALNNGRPLMNDLSHCFSSWYSLE